MRQARHRLPPLTLESDPEEGATARRARCLRAEEPVDPERPLSLPWKSRSALSNSRPGTGEAERWENAPKAGGDRDPRQAAKEESWGRGPELRIRIPNRRGESQLLFLAALGCCAAAFGVGRTVQQLWEGSAGWSCSAERRSGRQFVPESPPESRSVPHFLS